MTWQWVTFTAIVAVWAIAIQFIHSWKEVRMVQRMPDELLRQQAVKQ